jgi:hypothetical protein
VWAKCAPSCEYGCNICQGGLAVCTVCKAAEGELLTWCPGFALNAEAREACYRGNVIDFVRRSPLRKLFDHTRGDQ